MSDVLCHRGERGHRVLLGLIGVLVGMTAGCHRPTELTGQSQKQQDKAAPEFRLVQPRRQTVSRRIEQPGFNIEAFQETALYAKISGYVKAWKADIGDRVKKGALLAELDVPEMLVAVKQKEAAIRLADAQVKQARATVHTAKAREARATSKYERLLRVGQQGVIDRESVDETRLGKAEARADLEKAQADVLAAEAQVEVARADRDYTQTMLQYTQLRAPFDGVVTQRNVSERDFVQPARTGAKGHPLYLVRQIDPVRVVVNVPGSDAPWIKDGDTVSFRLQGAGGEVFSGKVKRNARSLEPMTRTLRTEIDVPNPKGKLLPGMYVQASITVRRPNVWTLPASAVVTEGDEVFCYRVEKSKAVRTLLQIGMRGDSQVEVVKQLPRVPPSSEEEQWEGFTGQEEVVSQPAGLSDGQPVNRSEPGK